MSEYRVLCADGNEVDRFDGPHAARWARLAAADADDRHDGARCTSPHRVEVCLGWQDVTDFVGCDACDLPTHRDDLATVDTVSGEGSFCSGCRSGHEIGSPAHAQARAEGLAEALA